MAGGDGLERELKFGDADLSALVERLQELGAERVAASSLEDNLIFDRDGALRGEDKLLRLRSDRNGARLTFKGPTTFEETTKVRLERETEIADAEAAREILEQLGYNASRRYQKMREEWHLGGVTVSLDHTPIGDYVEFEGRGAEKVASRCGYDPADAERRTYLRLYEDYLKDHPDAPPEMVFP